MQSVLCCQKLCLQQTATLFSRINLFQVMFEALKYRSMWIFSDFSVSFLLKTYFLPAPACNFYILSRSRQQNHAGAKFSVLFQNDSASACSGGYLFFRIPTHTMLLTSPCSTVNSLFLLHNRQIVYLVDPEVNAHCYGWLTFAYV